MVDLGKKLIYNNFKSIVVISLKKGNGDLI